MADSAKFETHHFLADEPPHTDVGPDIHRASGAATSAGGSEIAESTAGASAGSAVDAVGASLDTGIAAGIETSATGCVAGLAGAAGVAAGGVETGVSLLAAVGFLDGTPLS
jgi:hypothetical protein